MGELRAEVIEYDIPPKRKPSLLGGLATLALATTAGLGLLGVPIIQFGPAGDWQRPDYVVEGTVVYEELEMDMDGTASSVNPLLEDLGLAPLESAIPYLDSYRMVILHRDALVPVEFMEWSLGRVGGLASIERSIEPGDMVRIQARRDSDHYVGISVETLGSSEVPPWVREMDLRFPASTKYEVLEGGFLETMNHVGLYKIHDSYLVLRMSADREQGPSVEDASRLEDLLLERLAETDVSYCPAGAVDNIRLLGHADLIRLYLLTEYLDDPGNRTRIGRMLEADRLDRGAEHGGWASLEDGQLEFDRIPSACQHCGDNFYYWDLNRFFADPEIVADFHFHAQNDHIGNACPSGIQFEGGGDMDTVRELKVPGYLFVTLEGERFNASFYTKTAEGDGEVVINLGPYDYAQ